MSVKDLMAAAEELPESLQQYAEPEEKPVEQPAGEPAPEVNADPLVEKARQSGWRPKEEWEGDPDQWVDAKEFVSRKPLFDKIHSLNKALKDRDEKLKTVSDYATKAYQKGQENAIKELEDKRRQAVESGDLEAFEEADKQLQEARKEHPESVEPAAPEIPEVIQDFSKRNNTWFEKDEDMTDYALARAQKYTAAGMTLEAALEKVDVDVRRTFPAKFENPNKQKPAAVASGGGEPKGKTYGYADLNAEQRDVWSALKKSGMKLENYIAELREMGELK